MECSGCEREGQHITPKCLAIASVYGKEKVPVQYIFPPVPFIQGAQRKSHYFLITLGFFVS